MGSPAAIDVGLYAGSLVTALIVTLVLGRWSGHLWVGMLAGILIPPTTILVFFVYLESQAPVGPYFAIVGLIYAVPSLLLSACGAAVAAFLLSARD